jgi:hypothetical protein
MSLRRRSVAVALAAAATVAIGVTTVPAGAAQHTRVVAHCTDVSYQPGHYVITCADGGIGIKHADYTSWSKRSAYGTGTYYFNDCNPSCAGGTFHFRKATFQLYRVVDTKRYGPLFTRIEISTKTKDRVFQLPTSPIGG